MLQNIYFCTDRKGLWYIGMYVEMYRYYRESLLHSNFSKAAKDEVFVPVSEHLKIDMISVRFSEHLKSRDTVTHTHMFGLLHRWGAKRWVSFEEDD
jgi:hypothetical protein